MKSFIFYCNTQNINIFLVLDMSVFTGATISPLMAKLKKPLNKSWVEKGERDMINDPYNPKHLNKTTVEVSVFM